MSGEIKLHDVLLDAQVRPLIQAACEANGCPELADKIGVERSNKIVQSTGAVDLRRNVIKLSNKTMRYFDAAGQAEAVSRETCHLIAWHLYQDTRHHDVWHALMRKAGFPHAKRVVEIPVHPDKSKRVQRQPYSNAESPFSFTCGCRPNLPAHRRTVKLSPVTARQIALEGALKACDKCGCAYVLVENRYATSKA